MNENMKQIRTAKNQKWSVIVYGLGYLGKRLYLEIPSMFGLKPDFYTDGNDKKVDSIKLEELQPLHKDQLLRMKENCIVFILVDDPFDVEIKNMLSVNPFLYTVTLREIVQFDEVINIFYGNQFYEKYSRLISYAEK